jgi:glycosyltransferase involved in cell wall biosynthesis
LFGVLLAFASAPLLNVMPRVLILSNSPTPNNDALFAHISRLPELTLKVAYCAWIEPHRLWELDARKGYDYEVVPGVSIRAFHMNPRITRTISDFAPDVAVLTGSYVMPTFHWAVRTLERRGVPWVYWGEELSVAPLSSLLNELRRRLRNALHRAEMVLAIGSRAVESYAQLGIPRSRIADFRYYADVESFRLDDAVAATARASMRERWRVSATTPVFAYCGQLIARKDVETILRAADLIRRENQPLHLVLVGSGDREGDLRAMSKAIGIGEQVSFMGFVQPDGLPEVFAAADALVLPSRQEGWGLVVPEALAAGLPVIASDCVNSALDLVVQGESGFRFPVGDAHALADAMRSIANGIDGSAAMKANARAAVENESPACAATLFATLLDRVLHTEMLNHV